MYGINFGNQSNVPVPRVLIEQQTFANHCDAQEKLLTGRWDYY